MKYFIRHKLKHWIYDNHFLISCALIIGAFLFWALVPVLHNKEFLGSAVASAIGLSYFALTNHLKEVGIFKELFERYNQGYNKMNERLNGIRGEPDDKALSGSEIDTLFDYFNLCGEEYLYFKKGMIYPEVWFAWLNGMRVFYKCERIRGLWNKELESGSYYGLSSEILQGAQCKEFCSRRDA